MPDDVPNRYQAGLDAAQALIADVADEVRGVFDATSGLARADVWAGPAADRWHQELAAQRRSADDALEAAQQACTDAAAGEPDRVDADDWRAHWSAPSPVTVAPAVPAVPAVPAPRPPR